MVKLSPGGVDESSNLIQLFARTKFLLTRERPGNFVYLLLKYSRPSLYAVFLSANLPIWDQKLPFSGTFPLIYSDCWSFYV
jgi:hypothetical protein